MSSQCRNYKLVPHSTHVRTNTRTLSRVLTISYHVPTMSSLQDTRHSTDRRTDTEDTHIQCTHTVLAFKRGRIYGGHIV